jgi:hypothetical protein
MVVRRLVEVEILALMANQVFLTALLLSVVKVEVPLQMVVVGLVVRGMLAVYGTQTLQEEEEGIVPLVQMLRMVQLVVREERVLQIQ